MKVSSVESKKPGIKTTELTVGALSGGGAFELARQAIEPDMSTGAGVAVAGATLALAFIAMSYIKARALTKGVPEVKK